MKYLCRFWLVSLSLFSSLLLAQPELANRYLSHKLTDRVLQLITQQGQVTLTFYTDQAVEALYHSEQPQLPSFAKREGLSPDGTELTLLESATTLEFASSSLSVQIDKFPFRLRYFRGEERLVEEELGFFHYDSQQGFRFKLDENERLMGTGARVLGMDRRGHRLSLYNRAHYGYTTHSDQMNFSLPAVMSDKRYTLLFDNSANGWLDLGKTEPDILQFEATGGRHAYMVFAGETYPELIQQYVAVTGTQPLPPRWALGNHASRFGYRSQQEVLNTIAEYRRLDVPVDSVILDLYWFGKDVKGHMGNLDWDRQAFPEPEAMLRRLNEMGVKTVLITEPFVLTQSKKYKEAEAQQALALTLGLNKPKTFDFFFGHTGLVDVFSQAGQDWFGKVYQRLHKQGVRGVWGDLGEPEVHPADMVHRLDDTGQRASADEIHNVYGHQWGKLVQASLAEVAPNERPFMIMRSGFAGSQRYGMLPWTGDVSRSWGGLKPQVELSLQMGLLGLAYTHSDLGGFAGGESFDKEMYIRWLQFGTFQPIFRPHAQDNIAPEPVYHDEETLGIVRDYIKLRYRLTPYNYSLAYQNSVTGMPLMRPMFMSGDASRDWLPEKEQFMWGDSLLIKPVTEPNIRSIKVHLPEGNWFDYWTGKHYEGDQSLDYPLSLERMPILVKGGAIIPTVPAVSTLRDYSSATLKLDLYYDLTVPESELTLFEDDGHSADSLVSKQFELMNIKAKSALGRLNLSLSRDKTGQGYAGAPASRRIRLVIHNWREKNAQLSLNGVVSDRIQYDEASGRLTTEFVWTGDDLGLQLIASASL